MTDESPGTTDEMLVKLAAADGAILITADKDFGELFFRRASNLPGVVLLRLAGLDSDRRASLVVQATRELAEGLFGALTVITPGTVRVRRRVDRGA